MSFDVEMSIGTVRLCFSAEFLKLVDDCCTMPGAIVVLEVSPE